MNNKNEASYLPSVGRALWPVESENHVSGAEVLYDFYKLTLAHADNKLLVTRRRRSNAAFTSFIRDAAVKCCGNLYVAYIPRFGESESRRDPQWGVPKGDLAYEVYAIRKDAEPLPLPP